MSLTTLDDLDIGITSSANHGYGMRTKRHPPGGAIRLAVLMEQYQDTLMDISDASLVATAESLDLAEIFTIDHHFQVYRLKGSRPFVIVG